MTLTKEKWEGLLAYPYRLVATPTYPDCKCTKNNLEKSIKVQTLIHINHP